MIILLTGDDDDIKEKGEEGKDIVVILTQA